MKVKKRIEVDREGYMRLRRALQACQTQNREWVRAGTAQIVAEGERANRWRATAIALFVLVVVGVIGVVVLWPK